MSTPTITFADECLSPEKFQEQEAASFQWIEQKHSLYRYNTSCWDLPDSTTREQPSQSLPSASEGAPEGEIPFAPEVELLSASEGALPLDPEESLTSAPEVASFCCPSCCLDSVLEGDNVDNDNGTASGLTQRNLRSLTQYNTQYNVPSSQWVST